MEEDYGQWFRRQLSENELVDDRYDVKGMLVYRGGGMAIIKRMARHLEDLLEDDGHEPTLFPPLIPENLLNREADHIAGFEDEVYWVTHGGLTPLERKMALRPTSETVMYPMFALWTRTFTDLPIKVHQTVTVYRCETKQTRPLIRSREIYWNEGHTAFATREEALENIESITSIYTDLINGLCCLPIQVNKRPDWDKFPGAEYTIAFETIMPEGKTLQVATIHNLGQHFSKVFDIVSDDEKGEKHHAWQTSYGPGFGRLLAAVVSVHGDEKGMVLPPRLAATQAVIIPILFKKGREEVLEYVERVKSVLEAQGVSTVIDDSDERPGAKHYKWEQKGTPLRIEAGPRDLADGVIVVARRDTGEKESISLEGLDAPSILADIESNIRKKAQKAFDDRLHDADTILSMEKRMGEGIVCVGWCGKKECAKPIEERGTILAISDAECRCIVCGAAGKAISVAKTF